jgi:transposase-like protein
MKQRRRHSPDQIVEKLATADRLFENGAGISAVCKELDISEATYHRWRTKFGGLKGEDGIRLTRLANENRRLKKKIAEAELIIATLRLVAEGSF